MIKDSAQEEVINSSNKNLIVSASAGSGKTTVMIRKIIKNMIENGVGVKDILVLTYTKSAAEEMKQRLLSAIYENVQNNPDLLSQIDDLPIANISTIHSFFQKVLKKYFYYIGLDPSFKLIDELESENLKAKALTDAMQEFFESNPADYENLLTLYGNDRTDKKLQRVVKSINEFCMSLANPENWIEEIALKLYNDQTFLITLMNEDLCFKVQSFLAEGNKILVLAEGQEVYVEYLNTLISTLSLIDKKFIFFDNYSVFTQISFKNLKKDEENPIYNGIVELRKKINEYKLFLTKMNLSPERTESLLKTSKEITSSVIDVYKRYAVTYQNLKKQKNYLDFNDLERNMLKLLEHKDIKESLKKEFKQIYIDEYQDANLLQEQILGQISNGNNRFMVGDVKQSIYTFRQANPDIFLNIQKKYEKDEFSESKSLNSNFRSRKEILDFINLVFDKILTPVTGGIDYKGTSRFQARAEYKAVNSDVPAVSIDIVKREKEEKISLPPKVYSVKNHIAREELEENAELEARVVALRISELLGKEIFVNGEVKKVDFKDITVLLASRGSYLDKFCAMLSRFDIPVQANSREMLYSDNLIKALINILSLSVSIDDISLASSMLNFGDFTLNELFKIASKEGKNFYDKLSLEDKKVKNFLNILQKFKENILNEGIFTALNRLYDSTNFIKKLKAEDVLKVKKFTNEFLKNGYNNDVLGFLNFAEKNLVLAPAFTSELNAVNVTTIHASKGLEYPIVFLVNAGADFTKSKKEYELVLSEKLGLGLKDMPEEEPSLVYNTLIEREKKDEFAEKLRLFYVALTRAKNHLFIVGSSYGNFKSIDNDYDVFKQKSFLNLTLGSLNKSDLEKLNSLENLVTKSGVRVEVFSKFNFNIEGKEKPVLQADDNLKTIFNNYFNYKYPFIKESNIALKNSVSRIVKEEEDYSQNLEPKNFEIKEHLSGDASIIGTEYHNVMQSVDFNSEEIKVKIPETVNKDKILKAIENVKKILNQTKSKRILKEQEFMMYVPQCEVVSGGSNDKILIQGIIDLLSLGEKNIIIDYKLSSIKNANKLAEIYKTQLKLYKLAVIKAFNISVDSVYLYNFNTEEMIEIML